MSDTPTVSRMECMESEGMPTSTVRIPVLAATMGPIVVPQGQSLRTTNSCKRSRSNHISTTSQGSGSQIDAEPAARCTIESWHADRLVLGKQTNKQTAAAWAVVMQNQFRCEYPSCNHRPTWTIKRVVNIGISLSQEYVRESSLWLIGVAAGCDRVLPAQVP